MLNAAQRQPDTVLDVPKNASIRGKRVADIRVELDLSNPQERAVGGIQMAVSIVSDLHTGVGMVYDNAACL